MKPDKIPLVTMRGRRPIPARGTAGKPPTHRPLFPELYDLDFSRELYERWRSGEATRAEIAAHIGCVARTLRVIWLKLGLLTPQPCTRPPAPHVTARERVRRKQSEAPVC